MSFGAFLIHRKRYHTFCRSQYKNRSHLISFTNLLPARHCANAAPVAVAYLQIYCGQIHRAPKGRLNRSSVVVPRSLRRAHAAQIIVFDDPVESVQRRWALSPIPSAPACARREELVVRCASFKMRSFNVVIGVGKAFASPPSEPCWRFSRTRLSSRWFPHRGSLARYQTVDCVNSKKLREGGYSPPLTPLPAPTPCVSSAKRLRLAIVQVWLAHRLASLPRMALRHCRNYLASCQTSRIQLPTFLPIGAVC